MWTRWDLSGQSAKRAGTKAGSAESDETNEEGAYKNKTEHIRAQNGNRYNISVGLCVIVYTLSEDNGNITFCGTIFKLFFSKSKYKYINKCTQ